MSFLSKLKMIWSSLLRLNDYYKKIDTLNKKVMLLQKNVENENVELQSVSMAVSGVNQEVILLQQRVENNRAELNGVLPALQETLKCRDDELEAFLTAKFRAQQRQFKRYSDDYFAFFGMSSADKLYKGAETLSYVLRIDGIKTVLDVGSGAGIHSKIMEENGKKVTAIDYGKSSVFQETPNIRQIIADFNEYEFQEQFDCVWCCHILEHQLNPNLFLRKVHSLVKENGYVAITVPPLKQMIVGGHVTLWNAGLLLYHLVLAGFDCSHAHVKSYGYNVSVIVQKHTIDVRNKLQYDSGDLKAIQKYLPEKLEWHPTDDDTPFMGSIKQLNW